jgi:hypothetical protein
LAMQELKMSFTRHDMFRLLREAGTLYIILSFGSSRYQIEPFFRDRTF